MPINQSNSCLNIGTGLQPETLIARYSSTNICPLPCRLSHSRNCLPLGNDKATCREQPPDSSFPRMIGEPVCGDAGELMCPEQSEAVAAPHLLPSA